jgi:uncharacterized protein YjiS (DUF1127 family)
MRNPNSATFDLCAPAPKLVPTCSAGWPRSARPAGRMGDTVRALVTRFLAWRAQQATLRLLASLDAATLRDLGITDIESTVYGDPRDRLRGYHADR